MKKRCAAPVHAE